MTKSEFEQETFKQIQDLICHMNKCSPTDLGTNDIRLIDIATSIICGEAYKLTEPTKVQKETLSSCGVCGDEILLLNGKLWHLSTLPCNDCTKRFEELKQIYEPTKEPCEVCAMIAQGEGWWHIDYRIYLGDFETPTVKQYGSPKNCPNCGKKIK